MGNQRPDPPCCPSADVSCGAEWVLQRAGQEVGGGGPADGVTRPYETDGDLVTIATDATIAMLEEPHVGDGNCHYGNGGWVCPA